MEWTESLQKAIGYMEKNLSADISAEDIAKEIYISPFYFQKGFKIMTGYSPTEYMRNRRLYLAALDAIAGRSKIIDLAYKFGYDTPESFTKAFIRFHGVSPLQIRSQHEKIKPFLPLKIKVIIQGGNNMDFTVEKMKEFQVIGFENEVDFDSAYQTIPKIWDKFLEKCTIPLSQAHNPQDEMLQTICHNNIGEFGICLDDTKKEGKFHYLVAGIYSGGKVPEEMTLITIPEMQWARFKCSGPMPGALQAVNTKIFEEWLPGNPDFEIAAGISIERYAKDDIHTADYESEIWIPVKNK